VGLLSCVAMRCGGRGESATAEWAENYGATWRALGFIRPDGPSQSTVQRIFQGIDSALLESRLGEWAARVIACRPMPGAAPLPLEAMAIDGKTLRCSAKCGAQDANLLSAFSQRLGVVLGQVAVPDKTNEITAIDGCPLGGMLARLVLTGWVVTTDALFTQTEIAQAISDTGGDYLMEVKGNQRCTTTSPPCSPIPTPYGASGGDTTAWRADRVARAAGFDGVDGLHRLAGHGTGVVRRAARYPQGDGGDAHRTGQCRYLPRPGSRHTRAVTGLVAGTLADREHTPLDQGGDLRRGPLHGARATSRR